jgi:TonB family protein
LSGIFVSYRRSDSQGEAGRLFDDLVKNFGEDTVFMDVAAIEAGRDFRKAIEEGVTKCGVLLVVIGLEWVEAKDEHGARRLNDPADFVRIETASALKRDIPVIPVLVRGAKMPTAEQLPEELKELAFRNCIELTHARWKSDIQLLVEALHRLLGNSSRAGTNAGRNEAIASAHPGTPQQEATISSKLEDTGSARFDATTLQRMSRELAVRIGPIASIVVKRAASSCNSVDDLYLKVAEEIDSPEERGKFLRGRTEAPSSPILKAAETTVPRDHSSRTSELPLPSERDDVRPKTAFPATHVQSSNRWKYWLLATAVGIILILLVVRLTHFVSSKSPDSPKTAQTVAQEAHIAESASAKTDTSTPPAETPPESDKSIRSTATHGTGKSEGASSPPVHISEEVASGLLINKVSPAYPALARQTKVQGTVVLDANISKEGTVESLKLVSGHPLLIQSAIETAKQLRYKPYLQNGQPVAFNTRIAVRFTLIAQ